MILDKLLFDDKEKAWVICWGTVKVGELLLPCCKSDQSKEELECKGTCRSETWFWILAPHVPVMWPCRFALILRTMLLICAIYHTLWKTTGRNLSKGKLYIAKYYCTTSWFCWGPTGIGIQTVQKKSRCWLNKILDRQDHLELQKEVTLWEG